MLIQEKEIQKKLYKAEDNQLFKTTFAKHKTCYNSVRNFKKKKKLKKKKNKIT